MVIRPSVLCPIDFSEASRGALRYAAAIAEHFCAQLTVLAVDDPLIATTADARFGRGWLEHRTNQHLEEFVRRAFPGRTPQMSELDRVVTTGTAATEILATAARTHADLIVMSTHGSTGIRKLVLGSTTERVLRDTPLPVIVTPAHDPGPESLDDWRRSVKLLLVPVDLSPYSRRQVLIARGLAEALGAAITLAHVLEPVARLAVSGDVAGEADLLKTSAATSGLEELARLVAPQQGPRTVLVSGEPATEIARLAREHAADVVMMALHSGVAGGPRMGTVTYRLLCEAPVLVVAWPPSRLDHRLRFAGITESAPAATGA